METNNNYFIVNMAERVLNGDYTLFLNQSELKKVICILNKNKCKYEIYSPYPDAEKVIVYSDIIPDVSLLEILCKKELQHKDILGSLFGYNISPNNYGNIIIHNGKYYLIVMNKLLKFFLTQFREVGRNIIEIEQRDMMDIVDYKVDYESIKLLCSSLRIDNVVSSITNLSRSSVDELFKDDNVLLNYEMVKKFRTIEEGDVLSIRRFGKYKFNQELGKNKKGKFIIEILKYK